jgi:hypothetical protein
MIKEDDVRRENREISKLINTLLKEIKESRENSKNSNE